jgi:transcriptional regulator with PAS, ATPase and Fis domain
LDPVVALQGGHDFPLFHLLEPGKEGLVRRLRRGPGRTHIGRQVLEADFRAFYHEAQTLHQILHFPHIPGPAVFLQDGEFIRVGGNTPVKVDVRIIAATNADLAKAVQAGAFRLDLYYRLNIINISIPPLRQRKEDIVDLVTHFVRRYRQAFKKDINFLPQSVINRLLQHEWPGNVRELENVIQRAVLMAKGSIITENELIFDIPAEAEQSTGPSPLSYLQRLEGMPLKRMIAELEREIILNALEKHRGNVALTATDLQLGKTAFYDKMKRYDIAPKEIK